ncbi:CHAT domain-containing protein [Acidocella aquatica]|uniref:CHAT domain-containing protein n=1 Tax=Acidocella aquatica TaxID=1922313 RepID=A0ABQ6A0D5_9PROT|nr:CHAT domain-containing tetratricopeptide repeat protein [Acidocella aquatica]GLR65644.1 CHAT domain-containing protein [Acidocella aquatica]
MTGKRVKLVKAGLAMMMGLALASCARPPVSAYDNPGGGASAAASLPVGQNTAGESCTIQRSGDSADVYCGSWDQPSAHVRNGGPAAAGDLAALAATSTWRASLEGSYACNAPTPATILDGVPAEVLACTQRFGGWPHVAVASVINGNVYYADGVLPALPPMQRAMGVMSGKIAASEAGQATVAASDQILAQRLAAQAFSSGDIGHYEALMALGTKANQAEDFPAAVIAYRAALALQQKKIGADNPGTVAPMLELALNLSDQAQYPQAANMFAAVAKLAPRASDPTAQARLLHYEGLDQLNQNHPAQALDLLRQAEALYAALLPPELLQAQPAAKTNEALFSVSAQPGISGLLAEQATLNTPVMQSALLGVIETWRYQAIALDASGDKAGSAKAMATANRIALANDIAPPMLSGRLNRTSATLAVAQGQTGSAVDYLQGAATDFATAIPGSRPVAETALLQAAALHDGKDDKAALAACRSGISLLTKLQLGTSARLITPCLDVFAAVAAGDQPDAQALYGEMFAAAELAQGSVTAQEIAEAAARLSTSSSDPKVASAIRAQQDAQAALVSLYQQRDELAHTTGAGATAALTALDKKIAGANVDLQQATLAEQAAAPNFGQLVQQVVPAKAVLALLRPDEAFLGITAGPDHSWLFFLHDGAMRVARSQTNDFSMATLVSAVRDSIEPTQAGLPAFDMADAAAIYQATVGPFADDMKNVHELVVAPSGPLLALPFALLPTGPASATDLENAPWLVRETTLAYVPAAANFVSLRKVAGTSAAAKPWFGFGDFRPVTLAQAQGTYNVAACQDSAALFANLPNLPYAKLELQAAGAIFGAGPGDELLGTNFTVPNVEKADLKNFRILHFATHALLPTDLPCQSQPAIVTSAPPGAATADDALLTTSDVTGLHLDADLVLLSACNTGGGTNGGEALSGLARSFFYAGARAMMVTQWSVNDQVSAYLVADTLSRIHAGADGGVAGSVRAAQLALIAGAGKGFPAEIADPFYWAAFSVIGDGGNAADLRESALSGSPQTGL